MKYQVYGLEGLKFLTEIWPRGVRIEADKETHIPEGWHKHSEVLGSSINTLETMITLKVSSMNARGSWTIPHIVHRYNH